MKKTAPSRSGSAACLVLVAFCQSGFSQGSIDTTPSWAYTPFLSQIGEEGATFGQTFTVPSGFSRLDQVSLWLRDAGFAPVKFGVYVSAWSGSRLTGPLLYQSGLQALSQELPSLTPEQVSFGTGGIPVTPGGQYMLFVTSSPYLDGDYDRGSVGVINNNVYAGGGVFYQPNGVGLAHLSSTDWLADYSTYDMPFRVIFSAVPEPAVWMMFALGVPCLVRSGNRRA